MNEVRHPSEAMCVLETNLICSRVGYRLSFQQITIPTGLLYVITNRDHRLDHSLSVHHADSCENTFAMQSRGAALNAYNQV